PAALGARVRRALPRAGRARVGPGARLRGHAARRGWDARRAAARTAHRGSLRRDPPRGGVDAAGAVERPLALPRIRTPPAPRIPPPRPGRIGGGDRGGGSTGTASGRHADLRRDLRACACGPYAALGPSAPEVRRVRARPDASPLPPEPVDRLRR